ncbi:hypothetical protein K458DRAFT_363583 [Lentithecium fluviatile CBS 122367]|uniref:RBR-type E3 ubiquitin transferase n=1 Tax=Lentithecium fluviatile CBS 122367 TaxID=1168545 RepID=A0A6G1J690_9PLEO|nr:hypothetical protein K458DRAFT_363583 [Lentithecium fluviatile CBS 122367]
MASSKTMPKDKGPHVACVACGDSVPTATALTLDCKPEPHSYCHACLLDLVKAAIHTDTSLFPPRCCKKPIPLNLIRPIIPAGKLEEFNLKVEHLSMPNPTDCYSCGKFVRTENITGDEARCVHCKKRTCIACKKKLHAGLCDEDPHVKLFLDTAKRLKWQECRVCKNMVELEIGCFHMICRCLHQFCYLCGARWKTCKCSQFDEAHLLTPTPGQNVEAFNPGHGTTPVCDVDEEHVWNPRNSGTCGGCGVSSVGRVAECENCDIQRCWRCINNRARRSGGSWPSLLVLG